MERHARRVATVAAAAVVAVVAALTLPRIDWRHDPGPVTGGTPRPYEQIRTDAAARERYDDCLLMANLTHAAPAAATACASGLGFAPPPAPSIEATCPAYRTPTTVGEGRAGGRTWQWSIVAGIDWFDYCTRTVVGSLPPGTRATLTTTRGWTQEPLYAAGPGSQWVLITSEVSPGIARIELATDRTVVTARTVAVPDYDRGWFYAVVVRLDTGRRLQVNETQYDARGRQRGPAQPHFFRLYPAP